MTESPTNRNRGIAPVIGYTIVIGLVLATIGIIGAAGYVAIEDLSEDPEPAEFRSFAESSIEYGINYTTGPDYRAADTEKIVVVAANGSQRDTVHEQDQDGPLREGDVLVENAQDLGYELGDAVRIVRVADDGSEEVLDTVVFPDERQIGTTVESEGEASGDSEVEIILE